MHRCIHFRGKIEAIESFEASETEWGVAVIFRDKDLGWEIFYTLQEQCEDNDYDYETGILCAEKPWLKWIIHQLAPHLGRDQELRALIEFELFS